MGFEQYHEPANELSEQTRTFARMIVSMTEEAEAINWYEQRISIEKDSQARAIMANAQQEEFKHFGMDLEFLLRRKPKWRATLQDILFKEGDIVGLGEQGERDEDRMED
ncbi:MAG: ferritin family protein [Ktedonobacterales bacterium]